MKPQRIITSVIASLVVLLSSGCDRKPVPPGGISTYLTGKWVLEKIVTPSGTATPGSAGYYQILEVGNDSRNDYISIRRNDKEIVREIEVRPGGSLANVKDYTVDIRYLNGQMLRYFLFLTYENGVLQGVKEMQVTPFMKEYSAAADTVRYFYRK